MAAERVSTYLFNFADTIKWDAQYDVVVIGAGGAGVPAAAEACDAGAKVLVVEKAPKGMEGGNARIAQQHLLIFRDYEDGVDYLKKCRLHCDLAMPDEAIETYVRESMKFEEWWNGLGYTEYEVHDQTDFPLHGGKTAKVIYTEKPNTQRYWPCLRQLLLDRMDKIDVWYESPADGLIQDPFTKTVLGVKVKTEGRIVNVRALNGVVMALGGFEDSSEMLQHYGNIPYPGDSTGTQTGEGVRMGIEVGAKIARMGAISGPYPVYTDPSNGRYNFHIIRTFVGDRYAAVLVGPDGTRFYDETTTLKHGDMYYHGQVRKLMWPDPAYAILDSSVLDKEIYNGWGDNNEVGIENGWIKVGKTVEELAEQIGCCAEGLKKTIETYNEGCAKGKDEEFGRTASLVPFSGKGYCAVLVTPGRYNTTGGPDRNMEGEVLATDGSVIPHLYGCGDLGGFGIGNYQAGYGLIEAWYSGRIAGINAAKPKAPVKQACVILYGEQSGIGGFTKSGEEEIKVELGENEYYGKGAGMNSDIHAKVKYVDGKIEKIEIIAHKEDAPIGGVAFDKLIPAMLNANSPEVDAISQATLSSNGLIEAVKNALKDA
ncbi:MAG: FAD-binding protein [Lachnospiraceae bacterium]|nr:FAD-binding protein [Lachnospiraceae bacterium]